MTNIVIIKHPAHPFVGGRGYVWDILKSCATTEEFHAAFTHNREKIASYSKTMTAHDYLSWAQRAGHIRVVQDLEDEVFQVRSNLETLREQASGLASHPHRTEQMTLIFESMAEIGEMLLEISRSQPEDLV